VSLVIDFRKPPADGQELNDLLVYLHDLELIETAIQWLCERTPRGLEFVEMAEPQAVECWHELRRQHAWFDRLVAEDQRDEWPF
jgi:hypothetical protein